MVAVAAPVSETTAPAPIDDGEIVPEMLYVGFAVAVNATPLAFAPESVTAWFTGVKLNPELLGVTVYEPLGNPPKLKLPELSGVAVALAAPLSATVVPAIALVLTLPEMLHVCRAKLMPATLLPATVTLWLAG
ncbi:MAG TPA: hypothetical protein VE998_10620, partial [Terriglobales bacterium]|nr:hypothetical protein [Terriglobales bacterium]